MLDTVVIGGILLTYWAWAAQPGVHVVPRYDVSTKPVIVAEIIQTIDGGAVCDVRLVLEYTVGGGSTPATVVATEARRLCPVPAADRGNTNYLQTCGPCTSSAENASAVLRYASSLPECNDLSATLSPACAEHFDAPPRPDWLAQPSAHAAAVVLTLLWCVCVLWRLYQLWCLVRPHLTSTSVRPWASAPPALGGLRPPNGVLPGAPPPEGWESGIHDAINIPVGPTTVLGTPWKAESSPPVPCKGKPVPCKGEPFRI